MASAEPPWARALAVALEAPVTAAERISGGDSHRAWRVRCGARDVFVKCDGGDRAAYEAEAHGLAWLRQCAALRVPEVLAVGPDEAPMLALEFIERGPPDRDFDARLGRALAELHGCGAPSFGLSRDNLMGTIPQRNTPCDDWPTFWAQRRIAPLVRRTRDAGVLDGALAQRIERAMVRWPERCGPPEPPARLHGDLWSGNVMCDAHHQPVLVDPAAYGGHREVDLAMMRLFGGFGPACFAAYEACAPLAPGAAERVAMYQLYPLLIHVAMFGRGWLAAVRDAIAAYE